ncbi:hypothetical protein M8C21_000288, partial [Ambrosia artemisiifolia]
RGGHTGQAAEPHPATQKAVIFLDHLRPYRDPAAVAMPPATAATGDKAVSSTIEDLDTPTNLALFRVDSGNPIQFLIDDRSSPCMPHLRVYQQKYDVDDGKGKQELCGRTVGGARESERLFMCGRKSVNARLFTVTM